MTTLDEQVTIARTIAHAAHAGQVDKAGRPYIEHPAAVADAVDSPVAQAAAWLHDVLEDTAVGVHNLRATGVDPAIVDAVVALTKRDGEPAGDYYERVAANPVATIVKLADMAHNADPARLARLDEATAARLAAKYAHGRRVLQAAIERRHPNLA